MEADISGVPVSMKQNVLDPWTPYLDLTLDATAQLSTGVYLDLDYTDYGLVLNHKSYLTDYPNVEQSGSNAIRHTGMYYDFAGREYQYLSGDFVYNGSYYANAKSWLDTYTVSDTYSNNADMYTSLLGSGYRYSLARYCVVIHPFSLTTGSFTIRFTANKKSNYYVITFVTFASQPTYWHEFHTASSLITSVGIPAGSGAYVIDVNVNAYRPTLRGPMFIMIGRQEDYFGFGWPGSPEVIGGAYLTYATYQDQTGGFVLTPPQNWPYW